MDNVRINLTDLEKSVIKIGFVGEKNHTKVYINCYSFFQEYSSATPTMVVKSPRGELYPVTPTKSGQYVIWEISESNVAYAGGGEFQLTFSQSGEVIKTVIGHYSVNASLQANGDPPDPVEDWLEEAQAALDAFEQDTSDAEAWAVGTRGGTPVGSTDPAYHNNASYWAAQAATSAATVTPATVAETQEIITEYWGVS